MTKHKMTTTQASIKAALLASAATLMATSAWADQQILDDLIVDGSACIGLDCVNGESFGFDTLRLKENNLRIRAFDTSTSASFPSRDWQITFNDTSNGGANKFSIDDIDGGRTPFTIEAGAPSNSLFVDDGGRIGFGTSTPVATLHARNGNTPTLRLEQDGSSGFGAQTWDVAGNEANFFIRDASNGSTLPLRIFPGAPSNALTIEGSTGDVGLGTTSPSARLHVNNGGAIYNVSSNDDVIIQDDGAARLVLVNTTKTSNATEEPNWILNSNGTFRLSAGTLVDTPLTLTANGNLTVFGTVTAQNGGVGGATLPDYVFEPDYELLGLPELKQFVAENKHLPNVPSKSDVTANGGVNMTEMQYKLLEKVEELTLYTIAQHDQIKEQSGRIADLEGLINELRQ